MKNKFKVGDRVRIRQCADWLNNIDPNGELVI